MIVESPAKARTISAYLGDDFVVDSSVGHIRDLPTSAKEIPDKFKKEPWARLGVDIEHDFEPLYVVDSDKKSKVSELRKRLADAEELLLATDEDREGEAIAWHLIEVLKPKVPVRRMVFHEITRAGDRARARGDAADRRAPGRRAGDPADPRPPVRLRGLARPLAQDHERALRRPRPVRGDTPGRGARARAHGLRARRLVGYRGDVRSGVLRCVARRRRRPSAGEGPRLRQRRGAQGREPARCSTRRARMDLPSGSTASVSPSRASSASRTSAGRALRS